MSLPWLELVCSGLAQDCAGLEADHHDALAEAATYRQMLILALEGWQAETVRADEAEHRLRQIMGREPWHQEEVRES